MQLKLNKEVSLSIWIDGELKTSKDWDLYSHEEDENTFFLYLKDPNTNKEIKIKMEKSILIEEI